MVYTTPLHKMIYIAWHGHFMWASTDTESGQADQAGASNDDVDFEKEMDPDVVPNIID